MGLGTFEIQHIYIYKDISEASQPLEVETDTSSVEMDSCFLGGSWILTTWIETVHTEAVISYSLLWYRNGLFNSMIYLRWWLSIAVLNYQMVIIFQWLEMVDFKWRTCKPYNLTLLVGIEHDFYHSTGNWTMRKCEFMNIFFSWIEGWLAGFQVT